MNLAGKKLLDLSLLLLRREEHLGTLEKSSGPLQVRGLTHSRGRSESSRSSRRDNCQHQPPTPAGNDGLPSKTGDAAKHRAAGAVATRAMRLRRLGVGRELRFTSFGGMKLDEDRDRME